MHNRKLFNIQLVSYLSYRTAISVNSSAFISVIFLITAMRNKNLTMKQCYLWKLQFLCDTDMYGMPSTPVSKSRTLLLCSPPP